ncbi:MAG: universal stress protein, partial [Actinomycetota bacterium]
ALEFVRALKGAGTKEVVITHVVDDRYLFPYRAKEARREREIRLEVVKKELEERGMKAQVHVPLGAPLVKILRLSEEEDVSLIVLGSHGKGFVREMLLGSVSENIILQAKRPVLVVHEKDIFVA